MNASTIAPTDSARAGTRPALARLTAPASMIAGALLLTAHLIGVVAFDLTDRVGTARLPAYPAFHVLLIAGLILLVVVGFGLHARGAGLVAVLVALTGTGLVAGDMWFEAFAVPWIATVAPGALVAFVDDPSSRGTVPLAAYASFGLFTAGWVAVAVSSLRARVMPVGAAVLLIAVGLCGVVLALPQIGSGCAVALLLFGYVLRRVGRGSVRRGVGGGT